MGPWESSSQARVDSRDQPSHHRLLPTTAVNPPLQQTALAVQLRAMSDDQKVHSVENDLEPMQCPSRLESPTIRKSLKHLDAPASQLLTQNPRRIPLMLLYQRDGPGKGRLKKTSSGKEKKKKIK